MSTKFRGQRRWVNDILKKFGDLQEHQLEPFYQDANLPVWVHNLEMLLMGICHPGLSFKKKKKWKAKDLGKLLGRQFAGEHLIMGNVPLSKEVQKEGEICAAWLDQYTQKRMPDFDREGLLKRNASRLEAWKMTFTKFMQESLASACERPYIEASAFFEAFGKAILIKPDELLTERTLGVGDKICWVMYIMWREVEKLQSVAHLHQVLERAYKPRGVVVKYKRIEKLCQRIGLKFREGAGRPKGVKNSDKSLRSLGVNSQT